MDNHYVPNLTVGPLVCAALKPHVEAAARRAPDGAAGRSHHPGLRQGGREHHQLPPEASEHVDRTIALIKENGCKAGLVLNPASPLSFLDHTLDKLDLVLLMSVNPGFGGQQFIRSVLPKVKRGAKAHRQAGPRHLARGRRRHQDREHRRCRQGGAQIPSSLARRSLGSKDYAATIKQMREKLSVV
jgi:ribulose-phosphate 3-epimerase